MKILSQLLADLREQKGLSQENLATASGINKTHIAKIENGESKPTMPTVFRICKALEVDPLKLSDLLADEFKSYVNLVASSPSKLITPS